MDGDTPVTNSEDIIDSRDVIARIKYLRDLEDENGELDYDDGQELADLETLAEQGEGYGDWDYGATLIRDTYFTEYAQQLAEDIGAINSDASWPATCIDWDQAARELQMDYTSIDFAGEDYWIR